MKKVLVIAFCLFATAVAQADEVLSIVAGTAATRPAGGATAAYVLDETLADVRLSSAAVTIIAKYPGSTLLILITRSGTQTIPLTITAPATTAEHASAHGTESNDSLDLRYNSATKQLQSSLNRKRTKPGASTEMSAVMVNRFEEGYGGEARTTIRSASYRVVTPKRTLTLFDDYLDVSPLTVSGAIVRGVHVRQGPWSLNAGFTTGAVFGSVLLDDESEAVIGGTYTRPLTDRLTIIPALYLYPTRDERGRRGGVASLTSEYRNGEFLLARGELGVSRAVGGAVHLEINGRRDHLRFDARYMPEDFSVVGNSTLRGFFADGSWSARFNTRFSADAAGSASSYMIGGARHGATTARSSLRWAVTRAFAATAGADYTSLHRADANAISVIGLPVELTYDRARFGASLSYRYARNSETLRASGGVRGSVRLSSQYGFVSAFYERQTDVPTLQVIFSARPDLALALEELGIAVATPDDLARVLRANPELVNLALIEGLSVNLSPARRSAGLDFAFTGRSASQQQLRLRLAMQQIENVVGSTETFIGSLSYSRRLRGGGEIYLGASLLSVDRDGVGTTERVYEAGVRHPLGFLTSLRGGGSIDGTIFSDAEGSGTMTPNATGIAGVVVELDGERRATTDANGRYAFEKLPAGSHVVSATVQIPGAYFTTPSRVTSAPGRKINFGVALAPGRIFGRVLDDAGAGVGGIDVLVGPAGGLQTRITTDVTGRFSAAVPPGAHDIAFDTASLAAGYSSSSGDRKVIVERDQPVTVELALRVARTIRGRLAPGIARTVILDPGARKTSVDAEGNFVFRSLAAGEYNVRAEGRGVNVARRVSVPSAPGVVTVELNVTTSAPVAPKPAAVAARVVTTVASANATFTIQLGAFRDPRNAEELVRRLHRARFDCATRGSGALTFVEHGAFATRKQAEDALRSLTSAGFESIIVAAQHSATQRAAG